MTSLVGAPTAIVLAAGESKRLGRGKPFETVGGKPMVERVVAALLGAQKVHDVVVVIPPESGPEFSWLKSVHVHLVENPHPEKGMISSIRKGLESAWVKGKDFLLCPADIPYLKKEIVDRVIGAFMARSCKIVIPAYKGLGGHPGMFAASLREEFFLHGDKSGAREVLMRHRSETVRINLPDPDICFDVDTPEHLRIAEDAGARWARVEREVEAKRRALFQLPGDSTTARG